MVETHCGGLGSEGQHKLPAHVPALAELVSAPDFGERHRSAIFTSTSPLRDELGYPREPLGLGAHHQQFGAHAALALAASSCGAPAIVTRTPPSRTAGSKRGGRLAADGVEREVDASNGLPHLLLGVVDILVGAQAEHESRLRVEPIPITRARQLGELHGEMADASGGASHQSRLPSLEPAPIQQRLPGGHPRNWYRRRLLVA